MLMFYTYSRIKFHFSVFFFVNNKLKLQKIDAKHICMDGKSVFLILFFIIVEQKLLLFVETSIRRKKTSTCGVSHFVLNVKDQYQYLVSEIKSYKINFLFKIEVTKINSLSL